MPSPPVRPGRLLEIGCASGSFLHRMAARGWQVEGIEFSEKAAKAARDLGYKVHTGPLETAPAPAGSLDLIVGLSYVERIYLRSTIRPIVVGIIVTDCLSGWPGICTHEPASAAFHHGKFARQRMQLVVSRKHDFVVLRAMKRTRHVFQLNGNHCFIALQLLLVLL